MHHNGAPTCEVGGDLHGLYGGSHSGVVGLVGRPGGEGDDLRSGGIHGGELGRHVLLGHVHRLLLPLTRRLQRDRDRRVSGTQTNPY